MLKDQVDGTLRAGVPSVVVLIGNGVAELTTADDDDSVSTLRI